jgi:hypothetical protein
MIRILMPGRSRDASLRVCARLAELRHVASNLAEVLGDVLQRQMVDHERRRFELPAGIPARGFDGQIGVAQGLQRVGRLLDRPADGQAP